MDGIFRSWDDNMLCVPVALLGMDNILQMSLLRGRKGRGRKGRGKGEERGGRKGRGKEREVICVVCKLHQCEGEKTSF